MMRPLLRRALPIATPIAVVLLVQWWTLRVSSVYFPPPSDVLQQFREIWLFERVQSDLVPSLARMLAGLVIGCGIGYALGLAVALGPRAVQHAVDPVIEFVRAIPPPAFLPFVIVAFGVGHTGKVLLIALGTTFPVLLNTVAGARATDPLLYEVCASYGIRTRREVIGKVIIPASMPRVFAGVQVSLALALILMVISEMVASPDGIGRFVLEAQRTFAIRPMWSGIVVLGLLGFALNGVLRLVEHRVLRWHSATHGGGLA